MKSLSLWTLKKGLKISNFKLHMKCASTQPDKYHIQIPLENHSHSIRAFNKLAKRPERKDLFYPNLPVDKIKSLKSITSIVVALNHVSWAKVTLPSLTVLNWNSITLPTEFLSKIMLTDILEMAHKAKEMIPDSDLYVMESPVFRWGNYTNCICMMSMLTVLLSNIKYGSTGPDIVFQKPSVVNNLYSLLVGGERISMVAILEKKGLLKFPDIAADKGAKDDGSHDLYSLISFQNDQKHSLAEFPKEKQESLSLALLITLTFLDVAVFQNPIIINKLQRSGSQLKNSTK